LSSFASTDSLRALLRTAAMRANRTSFQAVQPCAAYCLLPHAHHAIRTALQMLEQLMDRSFLEEGRKASYPSSGPGWQVVAQMDSSGLLKGVE